jgi:membrane-anchored protein YejM (alkaline phosphatase superfamily)
VTVAGWVLFVVLVVVLGVRVGLTEAVWPAYRVEVRPRRVVRGLDATLAVVVLALLVVLAAVIGPPLLAR